MMEMMRIPLTKLIFSESHLVRFQDQIHADPAHMNQFVMNHEDQSSLGIEILQSEVMQYNLGR